MHLTRHPAPARPPAGAFELEVHTDCHPDQNSLLEGLYKSGGNFCTQVRWGCGGGRWGRLGGPPSMMFHSEGWSAD